MGYRHSIGVRYGERDQQGVLFNARHLACIDDALDHRPRSLETSELPGASDVMLEAAKVLCAMGDLGAVPRSHHPR